jgi:hypothetical protein
MIQQPCGFKFGQCICLEHKLTKVKKAAGRIGTPFSASANRIKPPNLGVALCNVLDLFGGRSTNHELNEHGTTDGGRNDA